MSDYSEQLATKIEATVAVYGHVSFVDFERLIPEIAGSEQMTFKYPTVVLWAKVSGQFIDAIAGLMTQRRIYMWADPQTWAYDLDGKGLMLPLAKSVRPYKKPHWLKATFHSSAPTMSDFGMGVAA